MIKNKCKHINIKIISKDMEEKHLCILQKCESCNKYQYITSRKGEHLLSHWFTL